MTKPSKKAIGAVLCGIALAGAPIIGDRPANAAESLQNEIDRNLQNVPAPFAAAIKKFKDKENRKVVGGKPAKEFQFPWQVSLMVSWIADPYRAHFCGGSIVAENWVLTAAHCVDGLSSSSVIVNAGVVALNKVGFRRNVKRVLVHKDYVSASKGRDIALLELYRPIPTGPRTSTVSLMSPEIDARDLVKDVKVTATGWGHTQEAGNISLHLNYVEVPYVERKRCNYGVSYGGEIKDDMICAGTAAGGQDTCQGDSGGPLTLGGVQAGIVSWGEGCARPNKFGVYTRVSKFTKWVDACRRGKAECEIK